MKSFPRLLIGVFIAMCSTVAAISKSPDSSLEVQHWWVGSDSERSGAAEVKKRLALRGVQWVDAGVRGAAGVSMDKVGVSRLLLGAAPDVTQSAPNFENWNDLAELVLPLNEVTRKQRWKQVLFPEIMDLVSYEGHVIQAPLGIHRINSLLYNQRVFTRLGIAAPRSWADFEAAVLTLKTQGIRPLAWSDQSWQIASVLEVVLLSDGGPDLYRRLIVRRDSAAWDDPRVTRALERLRWLRQTSTDVQVMRDWTESVRELRQGSVGMMIAGDWSKGELIALGAVPEVDFSCVPVPGTENMHIYKVNTFTMLKTARNVSAAQKVMAQVLVDLDTQLAANRAGGGVPVRSDANVSGMDVCARDSWTVFASPQAVRVPSISHSSADTATKVAMGNLLVRFMTDPTMEPVEAQRRLKLIIQIPETSYPSR